MGFPCKSGGWQECGISIQRLEFQITGVYFNHRYSISRIWRRYPAYRFKHSLPYLISTPLDHVFYHRILKCHVLIDLKIGDFDHADAGQMNVYLNYYKSNEMSEGDNPPVGIILCASKDEALVEYATSGLAQEVFVSRYLTQLPDKEQLRAFIQRESQGL